MRGSATHTLDDQHDGLDDEAPMAKDDDEPTGTILLKDGVLCFGPRAQIDALLSVHAYAESWPKIPAEELHASSVQHPADPQMRWLLHTRRVPKEQAQAAGGTDMPVRENGEAREERETPLPPSAGVGLVNRTAWVCASCAQGLCSRTPHMPKMALANWMWLGRVAPEYRDISLGTRLLLGLGRPMIRKLYLGRGPRDEVQQGFQGNTMIMAQPRATYAQVVPNADVALESLIVMFCKSVDDVSRAHTLVVNRSQYIAGMKRRIRVCPHFRRRGSRPDTA